MKPIAFKGQTGTMHKPTGMTDEECMPLPVCVTGSVNSFGNVISCWKPTWQERFALLFGQPIWVWVTGLKQPPICLDMVNPFAPKKKGE